MYLYALSILMCLSVCLLGCLPSCFSVSLSACLSVSHSFSISYWSTKILTTSCSICISVCVSSCLSIHPLISLSVSPSVRNSPPKIKFGSTETSTIEFYAVINTLNYCICHWKPLHPSPIFTRKAGAYPSVAYFRNSLQNLPANIRLGWKCLAAANELA